MWWYERHTASARPGEQESTYDRVPATELNQAIQTHATQ